jgi:hypothetical protein
VTCINQIVHHCKAIGLWEDPEVWRYDSPTVRECRGKQPWGNSVTSTSELYREKKS